MESNKSHIETPAGVIKKLEETMMKETDPSEKLLLVKRIEEYKKSRKILADVPGLDKSEPYQEQQRLKRAGKDYPGKYWDEKFEKEREQERRKAA